jgi:hypothetical protein
MEDHIQKNEMEDDKKKWKTTSNNTMKTTSKKNIFLIPKLRGKPSWGWLSSLRFYYLFFMGENKAKYGGLYGSLKYLEMFP